MNHAEDAWMEDGVCRSVDAELWFPDQGDNYSAKKARKVCAGCPVVGACLDYALRNNVRHGVWGGKTERQRRLMTAEEAAA